MRGLSDLFEVPDLRKRILFALGAIAVYRIGASIPIPGVNGDAIRAIFEAKGVEIEREAKAARDLINALIEKGTSFGDTAALAHFLAI